MIPVARLFLNIFIYAIHFNNENAMVFILDILQSKILSFAHYSDSKLIC